MVESREARDHERRAILGNYEEEHGRRKDSKKPQNYLTEASRWGY
jgi:hypothetical protein